MDFKPINERISHLRIRGKWRNYSLLSVYAPTEEKDDETKDEFYDQLENTISTIPKQDMLILLGDFNAKLGKETTFRPHVGPHSLHNTSNDNGQRLAGLAAANNMMVVSTMFEHKDIHKETWVSNDHKTRNQIDHILVNARYWRNALDVRSRRGADADSDHFLVHAKFRLRIRNNRRETPKTSNSAQWEVDNLKDQDIRKKYQTEVENKLLQQSTKDNDVEIDWQILKSTLISATEKTIEKKRKLKRNKWYDKECEEVQNIKNRARLQMLQDPTNENIQEYNRRRGEARKIIRHKKREEQHKRLESLEENARQNNSRKFFEEISRQKKGYKPRTGNILRNKNNEELITDAAEVLSTWKKYFETLLNPNNADNQSTIYPPYQTAENRIDEPSLQETIDAINRLKNNKAPGTDSIPAECLKYGGIVLHERIHKFIVSIWNSETIPNEWRKGIIIPIHKKGDRMECWNYRGITLLNSTYKILSNILLKRLTPYAEENLGDYQCGFRPNRSTVDQIFTIRQILEKSWEYNQDVHQLFIDFRQAYDTIIRDSVWIAMQYIGVPEKLINMTKLCIDNTELCVRLADKTTEKFTVTNGLKQGDGLSPLLFNIVLDMAIKKTNISTEIFANRETQMVLAFADDIDAVGGSTVKVKESFVRMEEECKKVGLSINEDKSKYMHTSRRSPRDRIGQNITMDNYNFECVRQFKYLGTIITSDNDITEEIKARIQSGNKCYFGLQSLLRSRTLSRRSKVRIYQSIIKPTICYGCETWTLTKNNELLLQRFERKILRRIYGPIQDPITGLYRIRTNAEIERLYQSPNITKCIKSQRLQWAGHVQRAPDDRLIKTVWENNPRGTRPLGRPRLRWRDNIVKDLKTMRIDNWKETMLDRNQWRQIVFAAKTHEGL